MEYEKLIQFLEATYSSDVLCTLMTACHHDLPPINSKCDMCLIGFGFLEDLFVYKPTEELIETALDNVCNIFPSGDTREECVVFIDEEYEKMVDFLY
jgi:hypothetical protein